MFALNNLAKCENLAVYGRDRGSPVLRAEHRLLTGQGMPPVYPHDVADPSPMVQIDPGRIEQGDTRYRVTITTGQGDDSRLRASLASFITKSGPPLPRAGNQHFNQGALGYPDAIDFPP